MRTGLPSLALVACLATSSPAQNVWVVDAHGGPGADFTEISDAVAAAADGDIVLVRPGPFDGDVVVVEGKGLTITADVELGVFLNDGLTIQDQLPGQRVIVHGLDVWPVFFGSSPKWGLRVRDSQGSVWVSRCILKGGTGVKGGSGGEGLGVVRSGPVIVVRSKLEGGRKSSIAGGDGRAGFCAEDSTAALFATKVRGADSGLTSGSKGAPGAVVDAGLVYAGACVFAGGESDTGAGGDGLLATDADLVLARNTYLPAPLGLDVASSGGSVVELSARPPLLDVTTPVREGAVAGVRVSRARPGSTVLLIVHPESILQLLLAHGAPLAVSPTSAILVPLGIVPPAGPLDVSVHVGQLPAGIEGATVFTQALVSSGETSTLSNPVPVVVLDSAF